MFIDHETRALGNDFISSKSLKIKSLFVEIESLTRFPSIPQVDSNSGPLKSQFKGESHRPPPYQEKSF